MMPPSTPELLIQAGAPDRSLWSGLGSQVWRDLWRHRELFYFLAWRDVVVRYKQTVLGVTWAVIKAAVTLAVLTVVFGKLARMPSNDVPYPLLVLVALLPWQFFSTALTDASNSLVSSAELVSKVYFPRLLVPSSAMVVSLVDFGIAALLLTVLFAWYGFAPDWHVIFVPLFIILAAALALGAGTWLAALTVQYRDFRYIVALMLQIALYISPVGFSSSIVPDDWRLLYSLNPMVGVIEGFRWALLGAEPPLYLPALFISVASAVVLLTTGLHYFRATERRFADVI